MRFDKIHYCDPGKQTACGIRGSGVSPRFKTWSWDRVTCPDCLKERPKLDKN